MTQPTTEARLADAKAAYHAAITAERAAREVYYREDFGTDCRAARAWHAACRAVDAASAALSAAQDARA